MQVTDVVVVGAGPAGLCFARALAGSGLQVTVVEPQPRQAGDMEHLVAVDHGPRL